VGNEAPPSQVQGSAGETRTEHDDGASPRGPSGKATPGIVLVFADGTPKLVPQRLVVDQVNVLGRTDFAGAVAGDERVSRKHVAVRVDGDGRFAVGDAGSRNGTHLDGARAPLQTDRLAAAGDGGVVRFGRSLAVLVADLRRFHPPRPLEEGSAIVGPTLRAVWEEIRLVARTGDAVLFRGESGSGKELAARVFHEASGRSGPLVAVNCATIPAGVAERLLFGTKRGAYSGADKDAEGYLESANGGTLFLDEIAELDLDVQAKLLRAVETREILPLGASRPIKVDLRLCAASHEDLRALAGKGAFRNDLYFRIGRPEVQLPPLRMRKEEIPWHVAREAAGLALHAELIETCLLRPWPGNVRELRAELRRAAARAAAGGRDTIDVEDLGDVAGTAIVAPTTPAGEAPVVQRRAAPTPDDAIRRALEDAGGNVTEAARKLGMHRTQLRRWVARQSLASAGENRGRDAEPEDLTSDEPASPRSREVPPKR